MRVIGDVAREKLVDRHTRIFLEKADEARRDDRRPHLEDFFAATMDSYVRHAPADCTEAEAREITHVQANFEFFIPGWTEMMEIPGDELEAHCRRYEDVFLDHDITIDAPLGEFRPADGVADAPATPENLADPAFENAIAGFADDVYVEIDDGETVVGGTEDPRTSTRPTRPASTRTSRRTDRSGRPHRPVVPRQSTDSTRVSAAA